MEANPNVTESAIRALGKLYYTLGEHDKLAALREEATETFQTQEVLDALARTLEKLQAIYWSRTI